ncbi:hypothetical protein [Candidatus Lariskella endosymbiont of Hedychridium roseum]|uniref:hypothetical protein n=1 Tax=Candidatus Lariskella endosymbiont of Hedychridium roseum TaxID=3077949 RepID=UPI0030D08F5D
MPISATAEQVYNDVNTIATNLQNALTGGKFGDAFTSGMFANNKLSNLMLDAEKRLSQIAAYQKAVFVLKNACSSEFGIAQTLTAPTAEQIALKEACADFNALTSKGDGMKNLCNKVYFTITSASRAVLIVGQGSSSQISAAISPAGLPSIIKQGCEILNGAWNADGTEIINFSYTPYMSRFSTAILGLPTELTTQYTDIFSGPYTQFFDDVSNTDFPWITWPDVA